MQYLFQDHSQPFFHFGETLFLQKIEEQEWVKYIQSRFVSTQKEVSPELAKRIVELTDGHSFFVQYLSRLTWSNTLNKVTAEILDLSFEELLDDQNELFRLAIDCMTYYQLNYLRAVVSGESKLSSKDVIAKYDLGTSATVMRIENSLQEREVLDYSSGKISFCEPYFKPLFERHFMK